jgi:hypothetical protein
MPSADRLTCSRRCRGWAPAAPAGREKYGISDAGSSSPRGRRAVRSAHSAKRRLPGREASSSGKKSRMAAMRHRGANCVSKVSTMPKGGGADLLACRRRLRDGERGSDSSFVGDRQCRSFSPLITHQIGGSGNVMVDQIRVVHGFAGRTPAAARVPVLGTDTGQWLFLSAATALVCVVDASPAAGAEPDGGARRGGRGRRAGGTAAASKPRVCCVSSRRRRPRRWASGARRLVLSIDVDAQGSHGRES